MRYLRALLGLTLVVALSDCSFSLHLYGADLVNPIDPLRNDAAHNSQELAVRIYQLKAHENIRKVLDVPWEEFLGAEIPEAVQPFLAVPADTKVTLRPAEYFYIQRRRHRGFVLKLAKGTRWLLVVPRGVSKGERSPMVLESVDWSDSEASFCFEGYDIYKHRSRFWPCQRGVKESG